MKTNTTIKIATILGSLMFALPAFAATSATLSPATLSSTVGSTFTLTVGVTPQSTTDYVEKVEVTFPADKLEVVSFTQAGTWMPLTQSGYDAIDNTNGTMIKSAGYPSGFSTSKTFGTITFKSKAEGTATVSFGTNAKAYQETAQTAISGNTSVVTITSTGGTIVTTGGGTDTTITPINPGNGNTVAKVTAPKNTAETVTDEPETIPLTASAGNSGFLMSSWMWILALIILLILAWIARREYLKRKKNK